VLRSCCTELFVVTRNALELLTLDPIKQACRSRSGQIPPCSKSEGKMPSVRHASSRAKLFLRYVEGAVASLPSSKV
jgi:hypothetical protein